MITIGMARKNPGRPHKQPPPDQRPAESSKDHTHDLTARGIGEMTQAANTIIASWALQELLAQRAPKATHG
jgi:hypothetical protein